MLNKEDAIALLDAILEFATCVGDIQYECSSEFANDDNIKLYENHLKEATASLHNIFIDKVYKDLQPFKFNKGWETKNLLNIQKWQFEKPEPSKFAIACILTDDDTATLAKCIYQSLSNDTIETDEANQLLQKIGIK